MENDTRNRLADLLWGGRNGHPLEQEYSPLDAVLIGAGSSFDNAWRQAKKGYYAARGNVADAMSDPAAAKAYRRQAADNERQ